MISLKQTSKNNEMLLVIQKRNMRKSKNRDYLSLQWCQKL